MELGGIRVAQKPLQPRDKRPSLLEPSPTLVLLATGPKQWLFLLASTNCSLPGACELFMGLGERLRLVGKIGFKKNCRIEINKCLIKCLQNRT